MPFSSKISKNFDFGQNLRKFRFWSKFTKISILVKIYENFDFGQIFEKFSILVKIFENFEKIRF